MTAGALLRHPLLLVLDEPSAHLDSVMEARVRRVWSCDSGGDSNDSDETDGDIADGEHDPTASTTKVQQLGQQELDGRTRDVLPTSLRDGARPRSAQVF